MNKFPCPSDIHMTQESCHFGNLASISSYQLELDQYPIPDTLASYPFPEIEFEDECEPELEVRIRVHSLNQYRLL